MAGPARSVGDISWKSAVTVQVGLVAGSCSRFAFREIIFHSPLQPLVFAYRSDYSRIVPSPFPIFRHHEGKAMKYSRHFIALAVVMAASVCAFGQGKGVDSLFVPMHQCLERLEVTSLSALDQRSVRIVNGKEVRHFNRWPSSYGYNLSGI